MLLLTSSPLSSKNKNKLNKIKTPSTNKETKLNNINLTSSIKTPVSPIFIDSVESNEQNDNIIIDSKFPKDTKINQFKKIKKLIAEFEKEKNEKNPFNHLTRFKSNKNKTKNTKSQNIKSKNILPKQISYKRRISVLPNKKIYFNVPKIKSQMQFNKYLINDFKDNDSELDYIKRSLKYQKINEDFDELIFLKQIKEAAKNGIAETIVDETKKDDMDFYDTPEAEKGSNQSLKKLITNNISEFNVENILRNKNLLSSKLKRFYTEKIKIIPQNLVTSPNKKININDDNDKPINNNINQLHLNKRFITKINENEKEKENSIIEETNETKNINNNKSSGIKFLMETKDKNNEISRNKKKKIFMSDDKYNFSNRIYNSQKKEYNRYMRKKQYMRGKSFSRQIALINKEKEKYGIIETETKEPNTERGLPKLLIPNLLFQLQYKDIFKNSFNTLRVFEEGDQDLDLDDLNKIRKGIKEYEAEMFRVLKNNNGLNYIKKQFNNTTVGKFQSTKGIYFGA